MSARNSRYRTGGLLLRDFVSHSGSWAAFAAVIAALSAAATAFPLALGTLESDEATHAVAALPDSDRAVLATTEGGPLKTPDEKAFTRFLGELDGLAKASGTELAGALGPADFVSISKPFPIVEGGTGELNVFVALAVAPSYARHVTVVEGAPPAAILSTAAPIDIALTRESARALDWAVGESRTTGAGIQLELRLSAIVTPTDADDDYWALIPTALEAQHSDSYFLGQRTRIATVDAFIDPESIWALRRELVVPMATTVGFGLDIAGIPGSGIAPLGEQLRRFTGTTLSVGDYHGNDVAWEFRFSSGATEAIGQALERTHATAAVTAVAVSGPIGAALALLWLLAALFVARRRESLALLASRGAGETRIRTAIGLEALAVGIPSATVGAWAAFTLFERLPSPNPVTPGQFDAGLLAPAAIVVVVAALLLALATSPRSLRATRSDLSMSAGVAAQPHGARRLVLEGIVLTATAVSIVLLLQRGLATTALGFDPLLAAAPLLLCLSAGILALRLYPLPLLAVLRRAKRRRGFVAFLGSARAIRSPMAGLSAVLAVIVGLGVSLFSVIVLDTVRTGIAEASVSVVGADLRVSGPALTPDQLAELDALPGVTEAVGVYRYRGQQHVVHNGSQTGIAILLADTAALGRVQRGIPGAPGIEGDLTVPQNGSIPVVFSSDLAASEDSKGLAVANFRLVGVGTPGSTPSLGATGEWLLIDSAFARQLGIVDSRPSLALLDLDPGADVAAVSDAVHGILETGAGARVGAAVTVLDPATAERQHQSAPVVGWLQLLLVVTSIAMAVACAAACILSLVIAAPASARLLALLRTLGLGRAQSRGVGSWEIAPVAIVGTLAGCAVGLLIPLLVLPGVDLRPFTGGTLPPAITADPGLLAAVAAAFIVVVALATAIVMVTTRRLREAPAIKDPVEG
jgi:putative ABC transport system permease protein